MSLEQQLWVLRPVEGPFGAAIDNDGNELKVEVVPGDHQCNFGKVAVFQSVYEIPVI